VQGEISSNDLVGRKMCGDADERRERSNE
jgi:hypothetical protein